MLDQLIEQCHQNLLKNNEALNYLLNRGVNFEQIKQYQFGTFISNQKLPEIESFKKWSREGHLFRNRLIFPLIDTCGKVKALGTRPYKGAGEYLYYYYDRTEPGFFGLKNLEKIYLTETCYLTEGIFDHLVAEKVFENSLSVLTANISNRQLHFLKRYAKTLVFLFDVDRIGNQKVDLVIKENKDFTIYRISKFLEKSAQAKDLNQLYQILGPDKFKEFMLEQNNLFIF